MKCKWSKKYKLSKILLTSSLLISSISFSILASSCSNNDKHEYPNPTPPSSGGSNESSKPVIPEQPTPKPPIPPIPIPPDHSDFSNLSNFIRLEDGTIIVNPYTASKEVLDKYGNFPIDVKKSDNEITVDDLIKMFDLINIFEVNDWNFGARNIDVNLITIAYARWFMSHWKYFSTYFQTNPASFLRVKGLENSLYPVNDEENINNKRWNVEVLQGAKWANIFNLDTNERKLFLEFFSRFLSGYDPEMNELEKVNYAYTFVVAWMNYDGSKASIDSAYTKHSGVCLEYAHLLSICYNLIGLPSFPMTTGLGSRGIDFPQEVISSIEPHCVTWVYLDTGNGQGKKWYVSDATFGDSGFEGLSNTSATTKQITGQVLNNALFCNTEVSQFVVTRDNNSKRWNQTNLNRFFNLPFGVVYMPEYESQIGQAAIGGYSFTQQPLMYGEMNKLGSGLGYQRYLFAKPSYYNGYYYTIGKRTTDKNAAVYRAKLNEEQITDVTDEFFGDLPIETRDKILFSPMIYKIGDYFIFNEKYEKFRIHNMNHGSNWDQDLLIPIPEEKKLELGDRIYDFYVDIDGKIHIVGDIIKDEVKEVKLDNNSIFDWILQQNIADKYKEVAKTYFEWTGGAFKIKISDYSVGITHEQKKQYYQELYSILKNPSLNTKDAILEMKKNFNNMWKQCFSMINKIGLYQKTNREAFVTQQAFDIGGYVFDVNPWTNPHTLYNDQELYRYDIYYTRNTQEENKGSFSLVSENLLTPKITSSMLSSSNPNGRYYIKVYLVNNKSISIDTDFINLSIINDWNDYQNFYDAKIKLISESKYSRGQITNFVEKDANWYNTKWINLEFEISSPVIDFIRNKIVFKFYHINNSTRIKTEIGKTVVDGSVNGKITFNHNIGIVDNDNHGVYYWKAEIIDKQTSRVLSTQYSKNTYLFTKQDIDNFKLDDWLTLNSMIN